MEDDFETEKDESFAAELGKSVVLSAAGAVALIVGMYGGSVAVEKLKDWRKNRAEKKAETTEE